MMGVSAVFCVYLPRLHFTQDDFEMKKLLLPLLLAAFAVGVSSCSDDKIPGDPEGTVTLNMMDESNGKTMLDDSGIYIDKAQNFVSGDNCVLFALGKVGGLGAVAPKSLVRRQLPCRPVMVTWPCVQGC